MNSDELDWTLVRSFLAAIEHRSLLAAARATGSSQPTLGRHIAALEQRLGAVLFERTGRGLTPTDKALQLVAAARSMDEGAAALLRLARGAEKSMPGAVRISATQPVACVLLPPILARMRQALPAVRVELVVSNALSNLLRREADIALRMLRPQQSSLVAKKVGEVVIVACAHRDYLQRRGRPLQPQDLLAHDLIGGDRQDAVAPGMAALGLKPSIERFALRSDDLLAQWAAVRAGLGIGFIAQHVVRSETAVQVLLPAVRLPRYPIWLTVHREIRTNARIRSVYDFLAQELAAALG